MLKSRIAKNGTINFPSELRSKMNLKVGDEISFLETEDGIVIVPIRDLFDLIDENELPIAKEIIKEITEERNKERDEKF